MNRLRVVGGGRPAFACSTFDTAVAPPGRAATFRLGVTLTAAGGDGCGP